MTALLNLAYLVQNGNEDHLNLIFLKQGVNSHGAWDLGIANKDIKSQKPRGLYLLLSDDTINNGWLEWLKGIDYLVVQASYNTPVVDFADVVLPSRTWAERGGSYVTAGRRLATAHPVIQRTDSLPDEEILQKLTEKISTMPRRN